MVLKKQKQLVTIEGNFEILKKSIYKKPKASIIISDETLQIFTLSWGKSQKCSLLTLPLNILIMS